MKNVLAINRDKLDSLPTQVRDSVLDVLKAYDVCYIDFENGLFKVTNGVCVKASYAPDHEFIGVAYAKDMYTPDQRRANFKDSFGYDAPVGAFK
jgi:hypothetical protein